MRRPGVSAPSSRMALVKSGVDIRISGIVRAARTAHERIQAGMEPAEKASFLLGLRRTVDRVGALLAECGAQAGDLPAPSRRALADLERLAALTPDALPGPRERTPGPRRVGVRNLVRTRDRVLHAMNRVQTEGSPPQDALRQARVAVGAVERILEEEGATASALAAPSRRAFLLLRWIADEEHAKRYITQLIRFRTALARHLDPSRAVRVRFLADRTLFSIRPIETEAAYDVKLNVGFLAAGDEIADCLAGLAFKRPDEAPANDEQVRAFAASPAFLEMTRQFESPRASDAATARGRVRDLCPLFDTLNARYFRGALHRPDLAWWNGRSLHRFGFCDVRRKLIRIDVRLDDEAVPEYVLEFVLYHEMLHLRHGAERQGARTCTHTAAFRADERRHPRHADAQTWLGRLANPETARAPTPGPEPGPAPGPAPPRTPARVPRNAPCPCGSGRKHKKCCGGR